MDWTYAWLPSTLRRSKLTAPDFDRLARMPCPIASLASSGIRPFSSALACSCSRWAGLVRPKTPANSAQALEALISTMRIASIRGFGGSIPNKGRIKRGHSQIQKGPLRWKGASTILRVSPAACIGGVEGRLFWQTVGDEAQLILARFVIRTLPDSN